MKRSSSASVTRKPSKRPAAMPETFDVESFTNAMRALNGEEWYQGYLERKNERDRVESLIGSLDMVWEWGQEWQGNYMAIVFKGRKLFLFKDLQFTEISLLDSVKLIWRNEKIYDCSGGDVEPRIRWYGMVFRALLTAREQSLLVKTIRKRADRLER